SHDLAVVRLDLAGDHAQQCRLAGAVRADEADTGAVGGEPVHAVEDDLPAIALTDAGKCEHNRTGLAETCSRSQAMDARCVVDQFDSSLLLRATLPPCGP